MGLMGALRGSTSIVVHVLGSFPHLLLPNPGLILAHDKQKNNKSKKAGKYCVHFNHANFINLFTTLA